MTMTQLTIDAQPTVRPKVHLEVQTKAAWADDWRAEPYLMPVSAVRQHTSGKIKCSKILARLVPGAANHGGYVNGLIADAQ